ARGDGWHGQGESLRAPHLERQRLEVDVLLAMMRSEPMRDLSGIARNIRDHQPARALDRRHRGTGVAQREREVLGSHRTYEVHGKEVAVAAIVDRDEEYGARTQVEYHELLDGRRRHQLPLRRNVASGALIHPRVPRSARPARATMPAPGHLKQAEPRSGGTPLAQVGELQSSQRAIDGSIHESQRYLPLPLHRRAQRRVQAQPDRQGMKGRDGVVVRDVYLGSSG